MASGHIPDESIQEIRQHADIVAVISEYVALEQAGKNYKGCCPFHQEKTPSFFVSPERQTYHCYGCGAGGNVFSFLMNYEKYSFPEAVYILARRLGIRLPEQTSDKEPQQLQRTDALYQLHREVANFFAYQLKQSPQAQHAREYLRKRDIGQTTIDAFGIGYAPSGWDDIQKHFARKYQPELLLESGLMVKRKDGVGQYDRFRDRLMIPIHDDRGRIVAFGGRILGDGEPKYLNSPESPIFHKGQLLFGLSQTKQAIRQQSEVIIVEGYFDMIVPHSFGVHNLAATMGTALTEQHLRLLQRYTKKVVLMFDADPAGIKAVHRTLDLFLEFGFEVRAVILPHNDDPDTAIRSMGVEQFRQYIADAPLLLDFIRQRIMEQFDLARDDQRIACANQILPTIVKIHNITERNDQIRKTASLLQITEAGERALFEQFKKVARTGQARITTLAAEKPTALPPLERFLLKALLKDKRLIAVLQESGFATSVLSHPLSRLIVKELFQYGDKTDFEARILDQLHDTPHQRILTELFVQVDEVVNPETTLQDCLARLQQKGFESITLPNTRRLHELQQQKDEKAQMDALVEQKNRELLEKRKFLKKSKLPLEK